VALLGDRRRQEHFFAQSAGLARLPPSSEKQNHFWMFPADLLPVLIILRESGAPLARLDLEALPQRQQRQALIQVLQEQIQEDLRLLEAQEYSEKLFERLQSGECLLALDGWMKSPPRSAPSFAGRGRLAGEYRSSVSC